MLCLEHGALLSNQCGAFLPSPWARPCPHASSLSPKLPSPRRRAACPPPWGGGWEITPRALGVSRACPFAVLPGVLSGQPYLYQPGAHTSGPVLQFFFSSRACVVSTIFLIIHLSCPFYSQLCFVMDLNLSYLLNVM